MTARLGRLLQLVGMLILPIGLMYGLAKNDIGTEVRLLWIGGAFFVVGWMLARK
jgi:hypothetical protein